MSYEAEITQKMFQQVRFGLREAVNHQRRCTRRHAVWSMFKSHMVRSCMKSSLANDLYRR